MPYRGDPTSIASAADCAKILLELDQPSSSTSLRNAMSAFVGGYTAFGQWDASGLIPNYANCHGVNGSVIALGGIKAVNNPAALCLDYLNEPPSDRTMGCNPRVFAAAEEVWRTLLRPAFVGKEHVWVIGHSYGGAVAQALCAFLKHITRENPWRLLTLGAPRVGSAAFYDHVKACSRARWVTKNDPVPHAPFQPGEAPTMYGLLKPATQLRLSRYVHYMACFQVHADGNVSVAPSSELGPARTETAFSSWAIGASGFSSPNHSINAYNTALQLAYVIPANNPTAPAEVPDTPETPQRITPAVQAVINQAINGIADDSGINRGSPVVIPEESRVRYVRAGSMYQIQWQGEVIFVAPNLRQARSICRQLNGSNRTSLTMSRVETQGYMNALGKFLGDAAAGTDGFSPKLLDGGNPIIKQLG